MRGQETEIGIDAATELNVRGESAGAKPGVPGRAASLESVGKFKICLSLCILSVLCVSVVSVSLGESPQKQRVDRDRTEA